MLLSRHAAVRSGLRAAVSSQQLFRLLHLWHMVSAGTMYMHAYWHMMPCSVLDRGKREEEEQLMLDLLDAVRL